MKPFTDASFIVAVFSSSDEHNKTAWRWWNKHGGAICTTRLVLFEAENTIRGFPLNQKCTEVQARTWIEGIQRAVMEGLIERKEAPFHRVLPMARRLSLHHTVKATFGAMDILHVAAALDLHAEKFVSFDERQNEMAAQEGLVTLRRNR
jgi:predicted nucleic acid-binding protein